MVESEGGDMEVCIVGDNKWVIFVDSTWFVLCENPTVRSNDETED